MKNWQIVETVKQAQRREVAEMANRCIKWLRIQGFEVRHVQKGNNGNPLIIINPSPLCDKLEGAVAIYEHSLNYERRYKTVNRLDCEVRWEDKGGI